MKHKYFSTQLVTIIFAGSFAACGDDVHFHGGHYVETPTEDEEEATADSDQSPMHQDAIEATNPNINTPSAKNDVSDPVIAEERIDDPVDDPTDDPIDLPDGRSFAWQWNCNQNASAAKLTADGRITVQGAGVHRFARPTGPVPLNISGTLCDPAAQSRDILLVVDVSFSMKNADPVSRNSCGRLAFSEKILSLMRTDGSARIGLITFDSQLIAESFGFVDPGSFQRDFFKREILCAKLDQTNYMRPLNKAVEYFQDSQPGTSKEIYFISDGEPTSSSVDGRYAAKTLKESMGVKIITMMIDGDDRVLKEFIASRDENGNLMHVKVANANDLVQSMRDLTEHPIRDGYIKYRDPGSPDWQQFHVLDIASDGAFNLEDLELNQDNFPNGLELVVDYWDSIARHYGGSGSIEWE